MPRNQQTFDDPALDRHRFILWLSSAGEGTEWANQRGDRYQASDLLAAHRGQQWEWEWEPWQWQGEEGGHCPQPPQQEEVQEGPALAALQWLWSQSQAVLCKVSWPLPSPTLPSWPSVTAGPSSSASMHSMQLKPCASCEWFQP